MTTDERFDALEKALETSVHRQRITITALVLVAVAAAVMAVWPQSREARFDQITAKGLRIVNDAGNMQAYLYAEGLATFDAAGKSQVVLANNENGGFIVIFNDAEEIIGKLP